MAHVGHVPEANAPVVAHRLDVAAWGLFFVWLGIALLANVGWGLALLGVGVIALGGQVARRSLHLTVERFWVAVGVLFVVGAFWTFLDLRFSLVPIVLIVAGVALLLSATRRKTA